MKRTMLSFILLFLFFGCKSLVEQPNSPPEILVSGSGLGFEADTLTFVQGKAYEFKFKVSDEDKDQVKVSVDPTGDAGTIKDLKAAGGVYSAFYTPKEKGNHRIIIAVNDKIITTKTFLNVYFFHNFFPVAKFMGSQVSRTVIPSDTAFVYTFSHTCSDADGTIKEVRWYFDDEPPVTTTDKLFTKKFTYFGEYRVKLEAVDNLGSIGSADTSIYNALPNFRISARQLSSTGLPVTIQFEIKELNSSDPDISFKWNFGDGVEQTTKNKTVAHPFMTIDTFTVSCTATDKIGVATKTKEVIVKAIAVPPTAKFVYETSVNMAKVHNNKLFKVDGRQSKDGNGTGISKYYWYFKGSNGLEAVINVSDTSVTSVKVLDNLGLYSVGLKIVNGSGLESDICWNDLEIINSKPVVYCWIDGWMIYKMIGHKIDKYIDVEVKSNNSKDIDPGQNISYKWYVQWYQKYKKKRSAFRHIKEADNQKLPKLGRFVGSEVWVKLVVRDNHGLGVGNERIFHVVGKLKI